MNGHDRDSAAAVTYASASSHRKRKTTDNRATRVSAASITSSSAAAASSVSVPPLDRFSYVKKHHLCNLRVKRLLEETASENIHVWMKKGTTSSTQCDDQQEDSRTFASGSASSSSAAASSAAASSSTAPSALATGLHSFELDASNPAHLAAAETLHSAGASLYFRSPPSMVPEYVGGFSSAVGLNFAGVYPEPGPEGEPTAKGEIEIFCSKNGHVTDWHFDFMENFTMQLRGTKVWHLKKSNIRHPMRGATPHYTGTDVEEQQVKIHSLVSHDFSWNDRPKTRSPPHAVPTSDFEEYDTVILHEGDTFYHPAGIWHRVECSEDSVSVNISLIATDWASMVCDGIKQNLYVRHKGTRELHHGLVSNHRVSHLFIVVCVHSLRWHDDDWRSGICIKGIEDARSQLSQKLTRYAHALISFNHRCMSNIHVERNAHGGVMCTCMCMLFCADCVLR